MKKELANIVSLYEIARIAEERKYLNGLSKPYISSYNPRFTDWYDEERKKGLVPHMKIWTIEYFKKFGYKVRCIDDKNGFNVMLIPGQM